MQHDDDAEQDDDGDGVPDEVEEVCEVFWRYRKLWPLLFSLYACYASTKIDVTSLGLNCWTMLFQEAGFVSGGKKSTCKIGDADRLFLEVNAASKRQTLERNAAKAAKPPANAAKQPATKPEVAKTASGDDRATAKAIAARSFLSLDAMADADAKEDEQGGGRSIDRVEFLYSLVKIAITKYVISGELADVSEALERLLSNDVYAHVGNALTDPNHFRVNTCYTEPVTRALGVHERSLRLLFGCLCESTRMKNLISIDVWIGFLKGLEFIGYDLALRDAVLCFAWSRMIVVDGNTVRGHMKETHVPVEGFFEALVRLTVLKALPTTDEVAEACFTDAAGYVLNLQESDPEGYVAFLKSKANHAEWGEAMTGEPVHVRLDHMCRLMIGTMEAQIGRKPNERDGNLSEKEVKQWMKTAFKAIGTAK